MTTESIRDDIPHYSDNHYAVVDLGSNSFHLLITQYNRPELPKKNSFEHHAIQTINKVKQKVRLASGLDENNHLSDESIKRGLDCLTLFAKHLRTIPLENICIVATATLRIAKNSDQFINAANRILPKNIRLLSGEQEAETIFTGATCSHDIHYKQLVLDIGGASTELIIGENCHAIKATSLNLGCVSFRKKYFTNDDLTPENFSAAIDGASSIIQPIVNNYKNIGWQTVVGSSGTMQALAEILLYRQQATVITPDFLKDIQQSLIDCQHIDSVNQSDCFKGLRADRIPVLASGLAILMAIFTCLAIDNLQLSKGALREGLLFKMLTA